MLILIKFLLISTSEILLTDIDGEVKKYLTFINIRWKKY